ncbi:MAG: recombinase family protein [Bacteroidales bacterium]
MKKVTTIEATKSYNDNGIRISKLRVAAYCRVSTSNLEQLSSYEAQKEHYLQTISSNPEWELVDIYADEGISATGKDKRNDFLRLISDCEMMKIDLVITKSISRFARNTTDCIETVRRLKALGIAVQFEKENINTMSAESELVLTILSSIAAEESKSISQNLKWSHQKRAKEGNPMRMGIKMLGYEYNENKELIIVPEEAEIVRFIFNSYINGKSHGMIAKELMGKGVKTSAGKSKWTVASVKGIITNEKYAGDFLVGKHYTTEDGSFKRRKNYGEAPRYYITNHHPGIISKELFEKAQSVLEQRRKQYGIDMNDIGKYNNRYVFSNKGFCGECGCRLTRKITGANHYKKHITWYCAHYKDDVECKTTGIVEEKVHAAFVRLFNTLYCNCEQILAPFSRDSKKLLSLTHENTALATLESRINELIEEERLLIQLELKGHIDYEIFLEQDEKVVEELEQNRQKFNEIRNQIMNSNESVSTTDQLIATLHDHGGIIDSFDDELFDKVVERFIYYKRSTIGFVLYNGLELKIKVFKEER